MHLGGYCRPYFRGLQRGVMTMDHDAHRHARRTDCSRQAKNDSDSPYVECSKKADVMHDEAMMVLRHSKHMRRQQCVVCVYIRGFSYVHVDCVGVTLKTKMGKRQYHAVGLIALIKSKSFECDSLLPRAREDQK